MSKKYRTRNYVLLGIGILVLFVPSIISIFHVRDAASLSDKVPKEYSNFLRKSTKEQNQRKTYDFNKFLGKFDKYN